LPVLKHRFHRGFPRCAHMAGVSAHVIHTVPSTGRVVPAADGQHNVRAIWLERW